MTSDSNLVSLLLAAEATSHPMHPASKSALQDLSLPPPPCEKYESSPASKKAIFEAWETNSAATPLQLRPTPNNEPYSQLRKLLAAGRQSASFDLHNLINAMEQVLHDLNERMDAEKAQAHAGTMTNEDNSATAKDMADSFQASVGMVKWEVEQPLETMEVKVARELEWLNKADNTPRMTRS